MPRLFTPITSRGHDGEYILCDADGQPVALGQEVKSFRGETCVLRGGKAPHKSNSSGFVWVGRRGSTVTREFYASVFGLFWVCSVNQPTAG